jgi:putative hydrolase of the HAD superfamily
MIEAVTFDVTGTLVDSPRLGEIYSAVLARHGVRVHPEDARRLIGTVWQELNCLADPSQDRFTAHPEGERGWWMRFLERFCEHLGVPPPSRFAAAELFHRLGTAEPYEVFPEVPEVLEALARQGVRLGVVSNWDHRLPGVLEDLGLARFFGDAIVYSSAAGVEKPDPRIFAAALERLGVGPEAALHVGDGRLTDVEGAVAAGMRALHLTRGAGAGDLRDLSSLPALVASERAGPPGRRLPRPVIDL